MDAVTAARCSLSFRTSVKSDEKDGGEMEKTQWQQEKESSSGELNGPRGGSGGGEEEGEVCGARTRKDVWKKFSPHVSKRSAASFRLPHIPYATYSLSPSITNQVLSATVKAHDGERGANQERKGRDEGRTQHLLIPYMHAKRRTTLT